MSESTSEAATLSGPPVRPDLVAHVRDSVDALESLGDAPGSAARAAELLRATRETVAALKDARASADQAAAGRIHGYRSLLHRILEAAARRPVRLAFHATPFAPEWTDLVIEAVLVSDYAVGPLFFSRARALGDRTLFLLPEGRKEARISWAQAEQRILEIGRSLLALRARAEVDVGAPVAMLGANSPEIALFDLACLVTGTPNVPVPASAPPSQIQQILEHAKPGVLLLGDDSARDAVGATSVRVPRVHWLDAAREAVDEVATFESLLALGHGTTDEEVRNAASSVRAGDLATTMYLGPTGIPKSVRSHGNIVTKRFARAAAAGSRRGRRLPLLPPLYHTFGRWLEMLGCVFWGSVYAFVEDVSVESLLWSFQRVRPTFISVPKKWIQIADAVAPLAADATDAEHDREVARALVEATGGRLKRGLSAAGYLPPAVFDSFHSRASRLHSGFGMTEATGGVTMTAGRRLSRRLDRSRAARHRLMVAEDGELSPARSVRDSGDARTSRRARTAGSRAATSSRPTRTVTCVSSTARRRSFKNVQGETISPRRIESLRGLRCDRARPARGRRSRVLHRADRAERRAARGVRQGRRRLHDRVPRAARAVRTDRLHGEPLPGSLRAHRRLRDPLP
jgi:acyl-CoA synthetase (AMP-forming)/AMP-acid ligase II